MGSVCLIIVVCIFTHIDISGSVLFSSNWSLMIPDCIPTATGWMDGRNLTGGMFNAGTNARNCCGLFALCRRTEEQNPQRCRQTYALEDSKRTARRSSTLQTYCQRMKILIDNLSVASCHLDELLRRSYGTLSLQAVRPCVRRNAPKMFCEQTKRLYLLVDKTSLSTSFQPHLVDAIGIWFQIRTWGI